MHYGEWKSEKINGESGRDLRVTITNYDIWAGTFHTAMRVYTNILKVD